MNPYESPECSDGCEGARTFPPFSSMAIAVPLVLLAMLVLIATWPITGTVLMIATYDNRKPIEAFFTWCIELVGFCCFWVGMFDYVLPYFSAK